jgi:hypothetical protein
VAISGGGSSSSQAGGHKVLIEQVGVEYRVASVTGSFTTAFSGTSDPFCQPFGSCGLRGTLSETLIPEQRSMSFYGARIVKHRLGAHKVLADLQAGRFRLAVGALPSLRGELIETVGAPGATACSDRVVVSGVPVSGRIQGAIERFGIDPVDQSSFGPPTQPIRDSSRTHCQGPTSGDVDGSGEIALARVPSDSLVDPRLTLHFLSSGGFAGPGFSGSRDGQLVMTLVRRRLTAETTTITLSPGDSVG